MEVSTVSVPLNQLLAACSLMPSTSCRVATISSSKKAYASRDSSQGAPFFSLKLEYKGEELIYAALNGKKQGKTHIISSAFEHHAILHTLNKLKKNGFAITLLPVHENGIVRLDELEAAIREDTCLVTIMTANNEIGTIQPIAEIGELCKKHGVLFHTDAVQAIGHMPINVAELGVDLLSLSGHKFHGPKGIGFLYIKEKTKIKPTIFGGGQQKGMRSGTDNVPGIAGMALAVEEIYKDFEEKTEYLYNIKERFIKGLEHLEDVKVNGLTGKDSAPHVVSVSVGGIRSEVMLHALEDRGVYVSAGSACASNKPATSATLKAIGVEKQYLDSTLRFSFSVLTTEEEVDYTLQQMYDIIPMLRRYTRR